MVDVSVIITNYNTSALLEDCLCSVYEKTDGITYEVIVVDDASTDGSADMVRRAFPNVILVVNETNLGFVKANNLGVRQATGRYALLLNSDTILVNNAIKILTDFLERHPEAGVCGGWLRNMDLTSQVSYGHFPSFSQAFVDALFLNDLFPRMSFPKKGVHPHESCDRPVEVDYITGADILIRMELIEQLGLFDETFTAYCEEVDFCYRARRNTPYKIFFVPEATIIHLVGMSYGQLGQRHIQIQCLSHNIFLKKYHGSVYSFFTRLLSSWHFIVKMMVRSLRYVLVPRAKRVEIRHQVLSAWYMAYFSLTLKGKATVR